MDDSNPPDSNLGCANGSVNQARGNAGRDSDVDLVVVERDVPNRYAEIVRERSVMRRVNWL